METVLSNDGTPIAYERTGTGPPLVLVHGTKANHTRWKPVRPALEERFTVYAMDRRGHGKSGDSASYAIEREFEDVAAVVDAIDEPTHVLGHSFGAICSLEAALQTENVRNLVLYEPPIPVDGVSLYREVIRMLLREAARNLTERQGDLKSEQEGLEPVVAACSLLREQRAVHRYQFDPERFNDLDCPTGLLLGGESSAFFRTVSKTLCDTLPSSRIVTLPGQRHVAMGTAPELFVDRVDGTLTEYSRTYPTNGIS